MSGTSSRTARKVRILAAIEPLEARWLLSAAIYSVTDLGTLGGATSSAVAINSFGQVVGTADTSAAQQHAVLWTNGSIKDLGFGNPRAINNFGQIVGDGPLLWNPNSSLFASLPYSPSLGENGTSATGINDSGKISVTGTQEVDLIYVVPGYTTVTADQNSDYNLLASDGNATAVNNQGTIAGSVYQYDNSTQPLPTLISSHAAIWENGALSDLGTLSPTASWSSAAAINDSDVIAGDASTGTGAVHAIIGSTAGLKDINVNGAAYSAASGINDFGQAVGTYSLSATNLVNRAFLYSGGKSVDLNTLIPANSGWRLTDASAINDLGQIVGQGVNAKGQTHAFLLTLGGGSSSISGSVFDDLNSDGKHESSEPGLRGWTVYVDLNNNGVMDAGEPGANSDLSGHYIISGLAAGNYVVREVRQNTWIRTLPAGVWPLGNYKVSLAAGQAMTGRDFGNSPSTGPIVVNTTDDIIHPASSGLVSLRAAIDLADGRDAPTTISFDPKIFGAFKTITVNGSPLEISDIQSPITINGPTAGVAISGTGTTDVFQVDDNANVTLFRMTITAADSVETGISNGGGTVVLSSVTFTSKDVVDIDNNSGEVIATGSIFTGAEGIDNRRGGTLSLSGVTISGTSTPLNNDDALATLTNVTIADNGLGISNTSGIVTLANVTISANPGGGIINGPDDFNGGVSKVTLWNSIIAGNHATGGPAPAQLSPDVTGAFISKGFNLIGIADGSTGWTGHDLTGTAAHPVDAGLLPLGSYGGPTQTMPPMPGSPAINHGSNALVAGGVTTDQRGLPRVIGGAVDIGAVEVQQTGSISGRFYNDLNGNGAQNAGEPALAAWQVYIDSNNNGIYDAGEPTTFTDASGNYAIRGVGAGTYVVREVRQNTWRRSQPAGIYPLGFYTVKLGSGQAVVGDNFGNTLKPLLTGNVFNDANGNGKQDVAEKGLAGFTVYIDSNNDGKRESNELAAVTDASGNWSFASLATGTYTVRIVQPAAWKLTAPAAGKFTVTLATGQTISETFGEKAA